jgi:hypothetical protein
MQTKGEGSRAAAARNGSLRQGDAMHPRRRASRERHCGCNAPGATCEAPWSGPDTGYRQQELDRGPPPHPRRVARPANALRSPLTRSSRRTTSRSFWPPIAHPARAGRVGAAQGPIVTVSAKLGRASPWATMQRRLEKRRDGALQDRRATAAATIGCRSAGRVDCVAQHTRSGRGGPVRELRTCLGHRLGKGRLDRLKDMADSPAPPLSDDPNR